MDNRLFEVQSCLYEFEKVPFGHAVFGYAVTGGVIGVDVPFIFIVGIGNITFDIECRIQPFLDDLRGNPETSQLEINIFDPQRLGLYRFQCRNILRSQIAGNLKFADNIAAEIFTLELYFFCGRILEEFARCKKLTFRLLLFHTHHICYVVHIKFMPIAV